MKNFTLLIAAALTMSATASEAQTAAASRHKARVEQNVQLSRSAVKAAIAAHAAKAEGQALVYLPATQQEYSYNADDATWEEDGTYAFTYNAAGKITRQDETYGGEVTRTERRWTRDNMLAEEVQSVSVDGGKTFTNVSRREQEYDYFVPTFTIAKNKYDWDEASNQWVANDDRYYKKVERDADHNVTYLEIQAPYNGKLDPMERYTYTYDATTKRMTGYRYEKLAYDADNEDFVWQTAQLLDNITWQATDGQTLGTYEDWTSGSNRIASADIVDPDTEEKIASLAVAYGSDGGFTETITYDDEPEVVITTLKYTDANGSLVTTEQDYYDLDGDGIITADEVAMYDKEVVTCDAHGNVTLDASYSLPEGDEGDGEDGGEDEESLLSQRRPVSVPADMAEPELELVGASQTDYTYDPANGDGVLSMVMSEYDYDSQEYEPMMKIVTTSFTTIAATAIAAPSASAPSASAYYNAQGMKLAAPARGLTIVRKDGQTRKEFVK